MPHKEDVQRLKTLEKDRLTQAREIIDFDVEAMLLRAKCRKSHFPRLEEYLPQYRDGNIGVST